MAGTCDMAAAVGGCRGSGGGSEAGASRLALAHLLTPMPQPASPCGDWTAHGELSPTSLRTSSAALVRCISAVQPAVAGRIWAAIAGATSPAWACVMSTHTERAGGGVQWANKLSETPR